MHKELAMEGSGKRGRDDDEGSSSDPRKIRRIDPVSLRATHTPITEFITLVYDVQFEILSTQGISPYDLEKICRAVAGKVVRARNAGAPPTVYIDEQRFLNDVCGNYAFWRDKYNRSFNGIITNPTLDRSSTDVRYWKQQYVDAFRFTERDLVRIYKRLIYKVSGTEDVPEKDRISFEEVVRNLRQLVGSGISLNVKGDRGMTLLMHIIIGFERKKTTSRSRPFPNPIALGIIRDVLSAGANVMTEDDAKRNSLIWAAQWGYVEIMRILLDVSGVHADEKNTTGTTALMYANNADMARFLISRGANVREKAQNKDTPLIIASFLGRLDVVQLLLSSGANVDDINKTGATALRGAIEKNHVDVIRALLDNGADVNLSDSTLSLSPPLMYAARIGNMEVVRLLISKGADPTYTIRGGPGAPGGTAEALARASGHTAVADYLGEIVRKYGAFTIDRKIPDGKEKFTFVY